MKNNRLEYRMYFFVPYNISDKQKTIQAGHAALEYSVQHQKDEDFQTFVVYDKTWIVLDGGTTNSGALGNPRGTMQLLYDSIRENGIRYSIFNEPDLNDAMAAICFLADERVWDYENYPELIDYLTTVKNITLGNNELSFLKRASYEEQKNFHPDLFNDWVKNILGSEKNLFLRSLIKGKKLA